MERGTLVGATLAALMLLGAPARAGTLGYEHRFTTEAPGVSAGMTAHIVYPDYPGTAKPKSVSELVVELPQGTRFDDGAVPVCPASDAELRARGLSACAPDTEVGGGTGSVVTGFGAPFDPLAGDLHVVHGPSQLINLGTPSGSDRVLVISRGNIDGRRITYTVISDSSPPTPGGPPDGRTSAKDVQLRTTPRSMGPHHFMTTPDTCPAGGAWTFRLILTYEDGTGDSATSSSPCRSDGAAVQAPKPRPASLRLSVTPRRVRAGEAYRFHFRVRSALARCRGVATIRFGRARARTDRHGRATLVLRLRRPGRHALRATRPGCRAATATVTVVAWPRV